MPPGKCVCGHYFLPCLLNKCQCCFWEQYNNRLDGSLDKAIIWSVGKQTDVCGESVKYNSLMVSHIGTAHSLPVSFLVLQIQDHVENGFLEPQEIFSYAPHSTVFANAKYCMPCYIYALQV